MVKTFFKYPDICKMQNIDQKCNLNINVNSSLIEITRMKKYKFSCRRVSLLSQFITIIFSCL